MFDTVIVALNGRPRLLDVVEGSSGTALRTALTVAPSAPAERAARERMLIHCW
jgi:hypothetical protein